MPQIDHCPSVSVRECCSSVCKPSQESLKLEMKGFSVVYAKSKLRLWLLMDLVDSGDLIQPWGIVHKTQMSRPLLLWVLTPAIWCNHKNL